MAVAEPLRCAVGLVVGLAAHIERNIPQLFPPATTLRLEDAADELLTETGPLSYETRQVVVRIVEAILIGDVNRPWAHFLGDELTAFLAELGGP